MSELRTARPDCALIAPCGTNWGDPRPGLVFRCRKQIAQDRRFCFAQYAENVAYHQEAYEQAAKQHAQAYAQSAASYWQAEQFHRRDFELARLQHKREMEVVLEAEVRDGLRDEFAIKNNRFNKRLC